MFQQVVFKLRWYFYRDAWGAAKNRERRGSGYNNRLEPSFRRRSLAFICFTYRSVAWDSQGGVRDSGEAHCPGYHDGAGRGGGFKYKEEDVDLLFVSLALGTRNPTIDHRSHNESNTQGSDLIVSTCLYCGWVFRPGGHVSQPCLLQALEKGLREPAVSSPEFGCWADLAASSTLTLKLDSSC